MKRIGSYRAKSAVGLFAIICGAYIGASAQAQTVFDHIKNVEQAIKLGTVTVNGRYYMAKYDDLCKEYNANDAAAIQHFATFGKKEGRQPSPFFDAKYYVAKYPDLQKAFGTDYVAAFRHWLDYGIKEGRAASKEFDPTYYLDTYPDLVAAFGARNFGAAIMHFAEYGISEKRRGAKDFHYAGSNEPDKRCHETPFSMIIASDSQWKRADVDTSKLDNTIYLTPQAFIGTEEEKKVQSENDNLALIAAINAEIAKTPTRNVKGVIINGDLTEFGHTEELAKFKEMYGGTKVNAPLYLGLGNHDYSNNVDGCFVTYNNCANRMVDFMVDHVSKLPTRASDFDFYVKDGQSTGSLAYSWDMGNIHFVQLQYHPAYARTWQGDTRLFGSPTLRYTIKSSLEWLRRNLTIARLKGKYIIINMHDATLEFAATPEYAQFVAMVKEFKVSAIFAGHDHKLNGKQINSKIGAPLYLSGSANYRTYLVAKFDNGELTIKSVQAYTRGTTLTNYEKLLDPAR